jgi:hypothetical protein
MTDLKDRMKVIIFTKNLMIKGDIAIYENIRLTDYLVESKTFIAVTDAEVSDRNNRRLAVTSFLNVHRDNIEAILPAALTKMELVKK